MTTLQKKSDILGLIQSSSFQQLLALDSHEAFLSKAQGFREKHHEYFASKLDEEGAGISLFSTPMRGNNCGEQYGTWLNVAKLYGSPDLPFRVQAAEYVPWGVDVDLSNLGDYRTLGEAVDAAFLAHEQGDIELNVLVEDELLGRYVQGGSVITIPAAANTSNEARAVNVELERLASQQQRVASARASRYLAPVSIDDAERLMLQIKAKLKLFDIEDTTDVRLHLAAAVKAHLFAGQGELVSVTNNDLSNHAVEVIGTTLLHLKRGTASVYLDVNGCYGNLEEANASLTKDLTEIYRPELSENPGGKPHSVCWFEEEPWEVYLDENTFTPLLDEPQLQVVDEPNTGEELVNYIVTAVAHAYKVGREKRYQQSQASELSC